MYMQLMLLSRHKIVCYTAGVLLLELHRFRALTLTRVPTTDSFDLLVPNFSIVAHTFPRRQLVTDDVIIILEVLGTEALRVRLISARPDMNTIQYVTQHVNREAYRYTVFSMTIHTQRDSMMSLHYMIA